MLRIRQQQQRHQQQKGGLSSWQSTILISSFILLTGGWCNNSLQVVHSLDHPHASSVVLSGDECQFDFHCLNGGVCILDTSTTILGSSAEEEDESHNFKRCRCNDGFSGLRCANVVCPLLCQNGGSCQSTVRNGQLGSGLQDSSDNNFECKCHGYYTGPVCEIPYVNCGRSRRCYNGGICVQQHDETNTNETGRRCTCRDGFEGERCEDGVVVVAQENGEDGEQQSQTVSTTSNRKGRITALVICGLLVCSAIIFYAPTFIHTGTMRSLQFNIIERTKDTAVRIPTHIRRKQQCDPTWQAGHIAIETSLELT
jgi:hypothetical protein